ncbi:MAG: hypothetical protein Q9181_004243 [Wetmoreana brouardii]
MSGPTVSHFSDTPDTVTLSSWPDPSPANILTTSNLGSNFPDGESPDPVLGSSALKHPTELRKYIGVRSSNVDFLPFSSVSPPSNPSGNPSTNLAQPSATTPPNSSPPNDDCSQCWIIYKYVSVYYPPARSSNTDCLANGAAMPSSTLPPGLRPEPGSAYVVIPELSAGNACTKIAEFTSRTFTFGPGQLSTLQGPANITKEFNFADLPCPPPDVASDDIWLYNPAVNPAQTYAPVVAPFPQIYDLDPAFHDCTVGLNQGIDPAIVLPVAEGPTIPHFHGDLGPGVGPPHLGIPKWRRHDSPINAHSVPRLPVETNSPT